MMQISVWFSSMGLAAFGIGVGITKGRRFGLIWLSLISFLSSIVCGSFLYFAIGMTFQSSPFLLSFLLISSAAAGSFLAAFLIESVVFFMSLIMLTLVVFLVYSILWKVEPEGSWLEIRVLSSALIGVSGSAALVRIPDLSLNFSCVVMGAFMVSLSVQSVIFEFFSDIGLASDTSISDTTKMCVLGMSNFEGGCSPMYWSWFMFVCVLWWMRLKRRHPGASSALQEPLLAAPASNKHWKPKLLHWLLDITATIRLLICKCFFPILKCLPEFK